MDEKITCTLCGEDRLRRYRVPGLPEVFWMCPECESLWREGADPRASTEAYLSVYLESRGLDPARVRPEPVDADASTGSD
ncbi:hypothetical protein [Yinghuangia seranimata]|uniref:hypothetical protein n=1 Tax=Yinghuangia seranimata TaxID=408067 RepID=UPI00248C6A22|nr:hypothetical protein [Yinghuangia seranimata]MDI2131947.1 hypothetical protein [Yinghuangia seranimata]